MPKFHDIWTRWLPVQGGKSPAEVGEEETKPLLSSTAGRGLAALVLVGAMLMLIGRGTEQDRSVVGQVQQNQPTLSASLNSRPEESIERSLKAVLSQIAGVGTVDVYITFDSGQEQVVGEEVTTQRTQTTGERTGGSTSDLRETRRPVILRDDAARAERPLVLVEKMPRIRGVIVVAGGARQAKIRYEVTKAVETALGVPVHRVAVFARE